MRTAKQMRENACPPPRLQQAREFLVSDRPEMALDVLASPEESLLFNPEFWNLMATAFSHTAQFEDAEQAALTGLSLSPGNPQLLVALALCQAERGELEEAGRNLFKALLKEPRNTSFLCAYARVLCQTGHQDQAQSFVSVARSIDPQEKAIAEVEWLISYLREAKPAREASDISHGEDGDLDEGSEPSFARARALSSGAPDEDFDRISLKARQDQTIVRLVFWPLWPVLKMGLLQTWLVALTLLVVLKWQGLHTAAFAWAVFYVGYSLYGCVVPLLVRWHLQHSPR